MNNPPWSDANSDHIDIGSDLAVPSSPVLSRLRAEPLLGYTALSSSSASRNVFSGSGYGKNIGSNGDSLSSWDPREDEEDEDGLALAGYGEEDGDDETDEETEEKNGGQDGEEAEEEQEHEEPGVLAYVDDETNETEKVDVGRAPPDDDKEESNYQEGRLTAEPVAEENETDTESTVRPSAGSLSLASLEELEPGTATVSLLKAKTSSSLNADRPSQTNVLAHLPRAASPADHHRPTRRPRSRRRLGPALPAVLSTTTTTTLQNTHQLQSQLLCSQSRIVGSNRPSGKPSAHARVAQDFDGGVVAAPAFRSGETFRDHTSPSFFFRIASQQQY